MSVNNEVSMAEVRRVVQALLDRSDEQQERNVGQLYQLFGIRIEEIEGLVLAQEAERDPAHLEPALRHFKSQDWTRLSVQSQVAFATLLVLEVTEKVSDKVTDEAGLKHIETLCNLLRQICQSGYRHWLECHQILEELAENSSSIDKRVLLWTSASEFASRATEHNAENGTVVLYSTANLVWSVIDLLTTDYLHTPGDPDSSGDSDSSGDPDSSGDHDASSDMDDESETLPPLAMKVIKESAA